MNKEIKEIIEGIEIVIKHDGTLEFDVKELKILLDYITNLEQENEKKNKIIEETRKMLYKNLLDDYDTYTANVVCDFQSDFEEIIKLNGGDE